MVQSLEKVSDVFRDLLDIMIIDLIVLGNPRSILVRSEGMPL